MRVQIPSGILFEILNITNINTASMKKVHRPFVELCKPEFDVLAGEVISGTLSAALRFEGFGLDWVTASSTKIMMTCQYTKIWSYGQIAEPACLGCTVLRGRFPFSWNSNQHLFCSRGLVLR